MSIFDNVAYALSSIRSAAAAAGGAVGASRRSRKRCACRPGDEVAADLGRSALRCPAASSSALIARALAADPEVMLLDEPCSALDPISTAAIEELIVGCRESVAIVIVTHNLQQAFRVADTSRSCTSGSWSSTA